VTPQTRMMFIANPNNPTGTFLSGSDLEILLNELPRDVLLVLDEAYNEYLPPRSATTRSPGSIAIPTSSSPAPFEGLRARWPARRLRWRGGGGGPDEPRAPAVHVSSVALAAAEAALADQNFVARSYEANAAA